MLCIFPILLRCLCRVKSHPFWPFPDPYVTFLSGANAGIEALWHAATLLQAQQCRRVLVLGWKHLRSVWSCFTAGRCFSVSPWSKRPCRCCWSHRLVLQRLGYRREITFPLSIRSTQSDLDGVSLLPTSRTMPRRGNIYRHAGPPGLLLLVA